MTARLLGFDLESTGLDTATARVTEIGYCIWQNGPLITGGSFLWDDGLDELVKDPEISAMMSKVCGITRDMLLEFGEPPKNVYDRLESIASKHRVQYIVAHNGENYDRPLFLAELNRHGVPAPFLRSLPWIDTRYDIPFPTPPESLKLKHLALDAGFINPFPHRALFDVLSMLKVLSEHKIEDVVEYSKIPWIVVRALVGYDDRQLAKDARYSWEQIGTEKYPKCWVKKIKASKLDEEKKSAKFQVSEI